MLKKAPEETIEIMRKKIDSLETSAEVDRDMIKRAADKERKHIKLRRHVDKALCAIGGIMAVNCRDIEEWHRHGNPSLMYASEAKEELPTCPPITELYSSLRHIEDILSRPVEEAKKDTRFGY